MKIKDKKYTIIFYSGLLIFAFLALLAIFGEKGFFELHDIRQKKTVLNQEIGKLEEEKEKLKETIYALRSDNKEIEKLAREELNLVKPGDVVYQFLKEED